MSLPSDGPGGDLVHATCVAVDGRGLLILGSSGSGKSSLAIQMIALGAELVGDDLIRLTPTAGRPVAQVANPDIAAIEARGIGLLPVLLRDSVPLWAVLDLNHSESDRYPSQDRKYLCMGHSLPLLFRVEGAQFAASLLLYLRGLSD